MSQQQVAPTEGLMLDATGMGDHIATLPPETRRQVLRRSSIIAVIAFLTLIDLFGSQALLPTLVDAYGVSPAAMGFAVNASTIGMAIASLTVAAFANHIDRAKGIWMSLAILSIPTALLGFTDDLTTFTLLRVVQGMCMSAAFTLTLTYLSEECSITAIGGAMAAYITGNVASNLFGRLMASGVAGYVGLAESFFAFSVLNLIGAAIAWSYFGTWTQGSRARGGAGVIDAWRSHLANPSLRVAFVIGFILLFVFVGVFTYANFVISEAPFSLPQSLVGLVYLVFIPAILTTPIASKTTRRYGAKRTFAVSMIATVIGLALLLVPLLSAFLLGLAIVGAALFFAQSVATAYVGAHAGHDHAAASGLYLASYYVGGIAGAALLGQVFVLAGWAVSVLFLALLSGVALWLGQRFDD